MNTVLPKIFFATGYYSAADRLGLHLALEEALGTEVKSAALYAGSAALASVRDARSLGALHYRTLMEATTPTIVFGAWIHDAIARSALGAGRRHLLRRVALTLGAVILYRVDRPSATDGFGAVWAPAGGAPFGTALLRSAGALPAGSTGPGSGAWRPGRSTLIVCEQSAVEAGAPRHALPYVNFADEGCAIWLAEGCARAYAGVGKPDLTYWINAYDKSARSTPDIFINALNPVRVIALGAKAGRWCDLSGVPATVLPLPQNSTDRSEIDEYPLFELLGSTT